MKGTEHGQTHCASSMSCWATTPCCVHCVTANMYLRLIVFAEKQTVNGKIVWF